MFALVLFVCYLDGGCDDIVVDVFNTEQQCLKVMDEQRMRHGAAIPLKTLSMASGARRVSTAISNHCTRTSVSVLPKTAPVSM